MMKIRFLTLKMGVDLYASFEENMNNFKTCLPNRQNIDYPARIVEKHLSEIKSSYRKVSLEQNKSARKKILPFVTQYHPALPIKPKERTHGNWHLAYR